MSDKFAFGLFDLDWDVFTQHIEGAINRVPVLEKTGVKSTVCGPGEWGGREAGQGRAWVLQVDLEAGLCQHDPGHPCTVVTSFQQPWPVALLYTSLQARHRSLGGAEMCPRLGT